MEYLRRHSEEFHRLLDHAKEPLNRFKQLFPVNERTYHPWQIGNEIEMTRACMMEITNQLAEATAVDSLFALKNSQEKWRMRKVMKATLAQQLLVTNDAQAIIPNALMKYSLETVAEPPYVHEKSTIFPTPLPNVWLVDKAGRLGIYMLRFALHDQDQLLGFERDIIVCLKKRRVPQNTFTKYDLTLPDHEMIGQMRGLIAEYRNRDMDWGNH